ncbi:MAG: phospholipase D-like domain-containing protein [Actinomycetaceae bacterium]|nr:phospholipase D-like domain-containing protein [Actinomycetaceae bacterium]MDY6083633.1 phospholipase D-like domain-containing protein [Actinomycetaceae bacterium]
MQIQSEQTPKPGDARLPSLDRSRVMKALRTSAAGFVATQAAVLGAITAIDSLRKRRTPLTGEFPHMAPQHVSADGNSLTLYCYGQDVYDEMLADITHARHVVFFESFIVKDDETGLAFKDALIAAARRGVDVYVILDTWGNANQDPRFRRFPRLAHMHAINFPFVRTGVFTGRSRDKGRDHRKILVVDDRVGYVGGYNIGTVYAKHWRDTHIRIQGPGVWELSNTFREMWNAYRKTKHPVLKAEGTHDWNSGLQAVVNTPARNVYPIESMYFDALSRATTRAWITMAYFVPDSPLIDTIVETAQRGVDVRILIPQYSNHIYVDWVGRPHYSRLLNAGVRIFLYQNAMVHAKTMTVDGKWSTVGTANIDRLSLRGNFEVNMEIYSPQFAAAMEKIFTLDLSNAIELTDQVWEARSPLAKAAERVLGPLAPLL